MKHAKKILDKRIQKRELIGFEFEYLKETARDLRKKLAKVKQSLEDLIKKHKIKEKL